MFTAVNLGNRINFTVVRMPDGEKKAGSFCAEKFAISVGITIATQGFKLKLTAVVRGQETACHARERASSAFQQIWELGEISKT